MMFQQLAIVAMLSTAANGFVAPLPSFQRNSVAVSVATETTFSELLPNYGPGQADTDFARKYGYAVGKEIRTVGQAFADFTDIYGLSINALYKNAINDIVGTTHLIIVDARFVKTPIWSAGLIASLELLLKNYPERENVDQLQSAFFKSLELDEEEIRAEAKMVDEWASSSTKEDVEAALAGKGDSFLAKIALDAKADDVWMYSRYFGLGMVSVMKGCGIEMDKNVVYNTMEEWFNILDKPYFTPASDSDLFFKVKEKLDMMETMMKEIEIREKKRMAERLEAKAELALKAAERDEQLQAEIKADADSKKVEAEQEAEQTA